MSEAKKNALVRAPTTQFGTAQTTTAAQEARRARLEARLEQLTRLPKTLNNSSKPPRTVRGRTVPTRRASVRRAEAALAWVARCIRLRIVWQMPR
jgi:hypothetical protein